MNKELDKEQLLSYIFNCLKDYNNYSYFDQEFGDSKINDVTSYYYGYEIRLKNNICAFVFKTMPKAIKRGIGKFTIKGDEDKITHQLQIIQRSIYGKTTDFYIDDITKEDFDKFDEYVENCDNEYIIMYDYDDTEKLKDEMCAKLYSSIRKDKIKRVLND